MGGSFTGGSVVKNLPANAGHLGLIPRSGRSPGEGNGNPSHLLLAWEIPWKDEHGRLQSMGLPRVVHDLATKPPPPYMGGRNKKFIWNEIIYSFSSNPPEDEE